ncbi:MAG TPA: protein phosphatase 2C domain-containing protein [Armatimonadota bacterium]|nr:protein phosphatase 2C domain-containing protein [Armatimonadota bacterium]
MTEASAAPAPPVEGPVAADATVPAVIPPDDGVPAEAAAPPAETAPIDATPGVGELEELTEPLSPADAPATLAEGAELSSREGRKYRIRRVLSATGGTHAYEAGTDDGAPARVRYAALDAAEPLRREATVLRSLESPSFPRLIETWADDAREHLVTEAVPGPTLADAFAEGGMPLPRLLSILAQVAFALRQLHERGWVHLGIRPTSVHLGKPVRLADLEYATRSGEAPAQPFYHAGYSAPELLSGGPVDARADVYSVGALLFHAVTGQPIEETGADLSTWQPPTPVGGVPQILHRCLGSRETRYESMAQFHAALLRLVRRHAPVVRHSIAVATSIGLEPTRHTNQDAYTFLSGALESEEGPEAWSVLCVSDGMGGMQAGEVASDAAVRRLSAEAAMSLARSRRLSAEEQVRMVREWVQKANGSACDALDERRARGGATLVCGLVVGRRLTVGTVGDCRMYLVRGEEITPLTRDHSLVMALVMNGQLALDQVRHHPDRSTVTRSLGDRQPLPEHQVDTLEQTTGEMTMELQPGDLLLLCSDGLWEPVVEAEMLHAVRAHPADMDAAARDLVRLALERGGPDNIAVLLFRLDQSPVQPDLRTESPSRPASAPDSTAG